MHHEYILDDGMLGGMLGGQREILQNVLEIFEIYKFFSILLCRFLQNTPLIFQMADPQDPLGPSTSGLDPPPAVPTTSAPRGPGGVAAAAAPPAAAPPAATPLHMGQQSSFPMKRLAELREQSAARKDITWTGEYCKKYFFSICLQA